MAATDPVSEMDLESAFREDPGRAVELIDASYRQQLLQYLKRETWGLLPPDELMAAYQETILGVWQRACAERFDPCRPLRLVYAIAQHKAVDLLRRRKYRIKANEESLDAIADSLADTRAEQWWRQSLTPADRKEFREIVLEIVQTLPNRQRIVARCYVDCFEDVLREHSYRPLAEAVAAVTGNKETVASVKSAWRFAREKMTAELSRRGYHLPSLE